jgi:hypothetical protein
VIISNLKSLLETGDIVLRDAYKQPAALPEAAR